MAVLVAAPRQPPGAECPAGSGRPRLWMRRRGGVDAQAMVLGGGVVEMLWSSVGVVGPRCPACRSSRFAVGIEL